MKVHHILEDFSKVSGGVRAVVKDLTTNLAFNQEIITTNIDEFQSMEQLKCFHTNHIWRKSNQLKSYINQAVNNADSVFHIHGVWMYPQYITAKIAINSNSPFLITAHGMYEPWLWKQGFMKKKLYFNLLSKNKFKKANLFHAITSQEKDELYKLFNKKINIEVIPNLISFKNGYKKNESVSREEDYILFIGRIDPKKGIKMLIEVFSKINNNKFKLKIAGPDSLHKQELISLTKGLSIEDKVEFVGFIQGEEKYKLYREAQVLVTPSYSEVIGLVNLEAAIAKTPVITTVNTGLLGEWNKEGGTLINPISQELEAALKNAMSWGREERDERGQRLFDFVYQNYSWEKNLYRWEELYNNLKA